MTDAAPWLWVDDFTVVAVVVVVVVDVDVDVAAAVELVEPELDPPHPANPVESTATARSEATPSLPGRMQPGFATKWNMVLIHGRRDVAPLHPRGVTRSGD